MHCTIKVSVSWTYLQESSHRNPRIGLDLNEQVMAAMAVGSGWKVLSCEVGFPGSPGVPISLPSASRPFPTHVKHLSWREPCCTRDKHKLEGSGEPVSRAGRARRSPERLVHIWRQRRAPGCAMWDPADGAPRVVGLACGSSHSVVLLQSERKGGDAAFAASLCAHRHYCRLLAAAAPHRPCLCAPAYFKRCCVLWQFDIRRSNRGG